MGWVGREVSTRLVDFVFLGPGTFLNRRRRRPDQYTKPAQFLIVSLIVASITTWGVREGLTADQQHTELSKTWLAAAAITTFGNYFLVLLAALITARFSRRRWTHRRIFYAYCYASALLVFIPVGLSLDEAVSRTLPNQRLLFVGVAMAAVAYYVYLLKAMARANRMPGLRYSVITFLLASLFLGTFGGLSAALNELFYPDDTQERPSAVATISENSLLWAGLLVASHDAAVNDLDNLSLWNKHATAGPGQRAYLRYYYYIGRKAAPDVRLYLAPVPTADSPHVFVGRIRGHDSFELSDLVAVSVPERVRIRYGVERASLHPKGKEEPSPLPFAQSGAEIVSVVGLRLGDLPKDDWGYVVVTLRIDGDPESGWSPQTGLFSPHPAAGTASSTPCFAPVAITDGISHVTATTAVLHGHFVGRVTRTWFEFDTESPPKYSLAMQGGQGKADRLSPSTAYYYRFVAQNECATVKGDLLRFNTPPQ